jgi:hypothetical protein
MGRTPRDAIAFTIVGRGAYACGIDGLQGTLSVLLSAWHRSRSNAFASGTNSG